MLRVIIVLIFLSGADSSWAFCNPFNVTNNGYDHVSVNMPTLSTGVTNESFQASSPVTQPTQGIGIKYEFYNCTEVGGSSHWFKARGLPTTIAGVDGVVFPTEHANIFYKIEIKDADFYGTEDGSWRSVNDANSIKVRGEASNSGWYVLQYRIQFYVSGIIPPGVYNLTGLLGDSTLSSVQNGIAPYRTTPLSYTFLLSVTPGTCNIKTGDDNQMVFLRTVNVSDFSDVGSTSGETPFQIGLDCQTGVEVYASIEDASSSTNSSQALTLDPQATATGVGVQILYDGDLVNLGSSNSFYVKGNHTSSATSYILPFEARYVKTDNDIVAGSVSAKATIFFDYQ